MPQRKDMERFKKMRKWRLIVRNAAFSCTEEHFRKSFDAFGQIHEIVMPRKDNHFAGFCFIQYLNQGDATKAMNEMNGKKINGRIVAVDWAVPKDQYMTAVLEEKQQTKQVKPEENLIEKNLDLENNDEEPKTAKCESDSDSDDDEDETSGDSETEQENIKIDRKKLDETKNRPDQAVEEGRTLFVRGVPFETDDEEFREFFEKFGDLKYALICKYPSTGHSKGSGFVQFMNKDDADSCLRSAGTSSVHEIYPKPSAESSGLSIRNHRLTICKAVGKADAKKLDQEKSDKGPKDKRNLHLLRIGLIRAGTKESNGMSSLDASKRLRIESASRQKIKNLHVFVSPTRICVHNLPTNYTNQHLRTLCMKSVDDPKAKITECRIMRDLKRLNADGVGKSRGYAFVEFDQHEHALKCLKHLNNNPEVFSNEKRPIVEFSLENRTALNAKQKRLENFRANKESKEKTEAMFKRTSKSLFKPKIVKPVDGSMKLKSTMKPFPSHFGPKIRHKKRPQATETNKNIVKRDEKKEKRAKVVTQAKQEKINKNYMKKIASGTTKKRRHVPTTMDGDEEHGKKRSKKIKHWYEDKTKK